jgi:dolichol-phosphate mannosyltransferase
MPLGKAAHLIYNSPIVSKPDTKPLVCVPTYNESENIARLIDQILESLPIADIMIVDDGSPDGTGDIVDKIAKKNPKVHCLHRAGKMGLGTAYVAAFKWALERDYTHCFEMDADFSHDPKDLPRLLDATKDFDIAIGSRFYAGRLSIINWPLSRLILSMAASLYVRVIIGMPLWDCTTGFKCFKRKVLENLPLDIVRSEGYSFQIDLNFRAKRMGFTVGEVPIIFTERAEGGSKMSKKIVFEAIWRVWQLRFGGFREDIGYFFLGKRRPMPGKVIGDEKEI